MCIRDRADPAKVLTKALIIKALIKKIPPFNKNQKISPIDVRMAIGIGEKNYTGARICLLYTSDAADERSSVDLGGRRIINKKKTKNRKKKKKQLHNNT